MTYDPQQTGAYSSYELLAKYVGNFSTDTDQAIRLSNTNTIVRRVIITYASTALAVATASLCSDASGGGLSFVEAATFTALTKGKDYFIDLPLDANATSRVNTGGYVWLWVVPSEAVASSANVYIFGEKLA